jgi:tungstate transport system substrate-binding protein
VRVRVVAVGSGQALELGRRGDADVVVAHAPELERPLVDSGYFTSRRLLMHNDFLLVGPAADPAEAAPSGGVVAALGRIAASRARFVSRGDRSGTHLKELELWRRAGVTPPRPGAWYVEAGQAMAQTLLMASEKEAYALSDRSTFLVWRNRLDLVPLVEGDSLLFNVYHVLVTSPRTAGRVNHAGATALAEWLLSPEVQARIGAFGRSRFAQGLFVPAAGKPDRW